MPEERDIIVGAPTSHIPGSKPYTCEDCGAEVQLAPSGQQLRVERNLRVVCIRCGLTGMAESGTEVARLTPEQIDEIATEVEKVQAAPSKWHRHW